MIKKETLLSELYIDAFQRRTEDIIMKKIIDSNKWNFSNTIRGKLILLAKRRGEVSNVDTKKTHLHDTSEIVRLVPERMQMAALGHDIGKSGPSVLPEGKESTEDELTMVQSLIATMFAAPYKVESKEDKVADLLDSMFASNDFLKLVEMPINREKVEKILQLVDVSPEDNLITGFFRRHIGWGKITLDHELQTNPDTSFTPQMAFIGLNHHRFLNGQHVDIEGYTPIEADFKDAFTMEVVDFYQARRERGGKNHTDAWQDLSRLFSRKIEMLEDVEKETYSFWLVTLKSQIEVAAKKLYEDI